MVNSFSKGRFSFDQFIFILTALSGLASLFCMFFISIAVGSRDVLNQSVPGMLEITQMMLVLIIFLPLAYVEKNKGHLQITVLYSILPRGVQSVLDLLWKILTFALFAFLAAVSFQGMVTSFLEHEASWGDLAFPLWIPKLFIFIGCLSMAIYNLVSFFQVKKDIGGEK
jgi:TRAP-type C4-dicarboxylate transport system permease small subunit